MAKEKRDMGKVIYIDKDKWYKDGMKNTSHSQVESYSGCSLKWALQKVFRVKEDWSDNLAFGNVYHSCAEIFLKDLITNGPLYYKSDPKDICRAIEPYWEESFKNEFENHTLSVNEYAEMQKMSHDAIAVMVDYFMEKQYDIVKVKDNDGILTPAIELGLAVPVEHPFNKKYRDDYYLLMFIDAIVRDKQGRVIVLDHKTSGRKYSDFKVNMSNQLPLYVYGVKDLFKQNGIAFDNTVGYAVLLKQKKVAIEPYEKTVSGEDIQRMLIDTNMVLNGMNKRSICRSVNEMSCKSFCGYKSICLDGQKCDTDFKKIYEFMQECDIVSENIEEAANDNDRPIESDKRAEAIDTASADVPTFAGTQDDNSGDTAAITNILGW